MLPLEGEGETDKAKTGRGNLSEAGILEYRKNAASRTRKAAALEAGRGRDGHRRLAEVERRVRRVDLKLAGKVALVTAASKGLGRACAEAIAAEGAKLAIVSRSQENVEAAAAAIREATGAEVLALVGDVADPAQCRDAVEKTAAAYGRLDALVTNAGGPPGGEFMDLDDEQWEMAFQLTLMSVVRLVKAAVPHMRKAGGGRIVNIGSSSVKQPIPHLVLSNVFRPGLHGLFKHLSRELAPAGILINTVSPGRIRTERVMSLDAAKAQRVGTTPEEVRRQAEAGIPLGRYGEPEELGRVVAFLVSGANTYVTGQHILVDGGMVQAL